MIGETFGSPGVPPRPNASLLRIAISTLAASALPPVVALLGGIATEGRGWEASGFGPTILVLGVWLIAGAALIKLTRLRSVTLGVLFAAPLAVTSWMKGSPIGSLVSLAMGIGAGFLGSRGPERFSVSKRGLGLMGGLAAVALIPTAILAGGSPEQTVLRVAPDDAQILGSYREGDQGWFVVPSNTFYPDDGRALMLIHVLKQGLRWQLAGPGSPERPRDFDGQEIGPALPIFDPFGVDSPQDATTSLPEACAFPRIYSVPAREILNNCWLMNEGFLVETAPRSAESVEITMMDESVTTLPLEHPGLHNAALVFPTVNRNGGKVADSKQPLRFAFMDQRGRLVDAWPSMRVGLAWYQAIGRILGAPACRQSERGGIRCPKEAVPESEAIHLALVSIAMLEPSEFRSSCGSDVPGGEWVLIARTSLEPGIVGLEWDRRELFPASDGLAIREVVVGLTPRLDAPPAAWIDETAARFREGASCFPSSERIAG